MITTNIIFDHRGRAKGKNDVGPVEVKVTIDRKPYYINTNVRVKRCQFKNGEIRDHVGADGLNKMVGAVFNRVMEEVARCNEENLPIDVAEIRRRAYGDDNVEKEKERTAFVDWIEKEVTLLGLKPGTMKHYVSLVNRLKEFGKMQGWRDVTVQNIYKWDSWLHGLRRPQTLLEADAGIKPEPLNVNTIHNYHKDLKAMLGRAVRMGLIDVSPYSKLRGEFKRVENENVDYLTQEEVERFERVVPDAGRQQEAARDLFIFQMYTGLAYADTQVFDIKDYREEDGRWVSVGQRVKTGVPYVSVLLSPAVEVLKKYNMRTPKMAVQVYNRHLKVLGYMAKIDKPLHSHMARHTFATWMLSKGAKIENVSRMLGHTNIVQTQRYAKVLAKSVQDDFAMIENELKNK